MDRMLHMECMMRGCRSQLSETEIVEGKRGKRSECAGVSMMMMKRV